MKATFTLHEPLDWTISNPLISNTVDYIRGLPGITHTCELDDDPAEWGSPDLRIDSYKTPKGTRFDVNQLLGSYCRVSVIGSTERVQAAIKHLQSKFPALELDS